MACPLGQKERLEGWIHEKAFLARLIKRHRHGANGIQQTAPRGPTDGGWYEIGGILRRDGKNGSAEKN